MIDLEVNLKRIVSVLDDLQIPYFIGGSVASSLIGTFRHTNDIDIVAELSKERSVQLHSEIKSEFYIDLDTVYEAIHTNSSFSILHLKTMMKTDIFLKKRDAWSNEAFDRRKKTSFVINDKPLALFMPSVEDMILQKLIWFQLTGGASERQWNDVKSMIKVRANEIDYRYLFKWSDWLQITEILDQAVAEYESEMELTLEKEG